jgi:predicted dehydrogenase
MKYALFGVSHPHLPAWIAAARALEVELPVVYDPDPTLAAATAAELNAEVIGPADLANAGLDGALVIARNDQQYDLATQCVEQSLPTLLEKTGAQTAAQFQRLVELTNRTAVPVQIAYYLRYSDSVRFTKDLLTTHGLGRVSLARFHVGMPQIAWDQHGNWFRNKQLVTSLFTEEACHVLDPLVALARIRWPQFWITTGIWFTSTSSPSRRIHGWKAGTYRSMGQKLHYVADCSQRGRRSCAAADGGRRSASRSPTA